MEEEEALLKRLYYNTQTGFLSAKKFWRKVNDEGHKISFKKVKAWLDKQKVQQVTGVPRKSPIFNSIVADYVSQNYQMDTMYFRGHSYRGYEYILLVIDVKSRYLAGYPMKTRKQEEYKRGFKQIVKKQMDGLYPEDLSCDGEYVSDEFQDFCDRKDVTIHYSLSGQPYKNAIVERVIRTLRQFLSRWTLGDVEGTAGVDWPDALPDILKNYNNTYHSTIKQKPIDVWKLKAENLQKVNWVPKRMKVGDTVRYIIRLNDKIFLKSDDRRYSKNVYVITADEGSRWRLQAPEGANYPDPDYLFFEHELKKVPTPEGNTNFEVAANIREVSAIEKRLRAENIGEVSRNDVGQPILKQLILPTGQKRKSKQVIRYTDKQTRPNQKRQKTTNKK